MNQREVLIISITIFLTVIGWIVADLLHVANTDQLENNDPRFSQKINVEIDMEVFDSLESRE